LQCGAVCCSVLQCVAVCCSVLQCVAVCCSVLQCVAVTVCTYCASHNVRYMRTLCDSKEVGKHTYFARNARFTHYMQTMCDSKELVCCSVLQCVAVCCSVLQCEFSWYFCVGTFVEIRTICDCGIATEFLTLPANPRQERKAWIDWETLNIGYWCPISLLGA